MDFSQIINSEENPVKVKVVSGSGENSNSLGTFETDANGELVLRVVDAAPFAYDSNTDSKKVSVVAGKKVKAQLFSFSDTDADGETVLEVVPPPRKVWKIQNMNVDVASISDATGEHDIYFRIGTNSSRSDVLNSSAPATTRMISARGAFGNNVSASPEDASMQQRAIKGLYISEDCPLYVVYQNKSDLATTGISYISISAVEEGEL